MRDIHLICNAHLDPVWQWEWQEGLAEALSTFRIAADFCEQQDGFVFNHNEAVLYQWVEEYDPSLFARIQSLVRDGRWHVMGGRYPEAVDGAVFCGEWADYVPVPYAGIRRPNAHEDEDGLCCPAEVELCGAAVLATDRADRPLLVKHTVGKGQVYLLCTYAYPGHEALKTFLPAVIDRLVTTYAETAVRLGGDCEDVYLSVWGEPDQPDKLYLLNTDWTVAGNQKVVTVTTATATGTFAVTEGNMREITLLSGGFLWTEDTEASLTKIGADTYMLCCMNGTRLHVQGRTVTVDGLPFTDGDEVAAGNHIVVSK